MHSALPVLIFPPFMSFMVYRAPLIILFEQIRVGGP